MISKLIRKFTVWRYKRKVAQRLERAKFDAMRDEMMNEWATPMSNYTYSKSTYTVNGKEVDKDVFDKAWDTFNFKVKLPESDDILDSEIIEEKQ